MGGDLVELGNSDEMDQDRVFEKLYQSEMWRTYCKLEFDRLIAVDSALKYASLMLIVLLSSNAIVGAERATTWGILLGLVATGISVWALTYEPGKRAQEFAYCLEMWIPVSAEWDRIWADGILDGPELEAATERFDVVSARSARLTWRRRQIDEAKRLVKLSRGLE